jgi:hypothetical protein
VKSRPIHDEQLSTDIILIFNSDLNMKILLPVDESFPRNDMKDLCIGDLNLQSCSLYLKDHFVGVAICEG